MKKSRNPAISAPTPAQEAAFAVCKAYGNLENLVPRFQGDEHIAVAKGDMTVEQALAALHPEVERTRQSLLALKANPAPVLAAIEAFEAAKKNLETFREQEKLSERQTQA